MKYVTLDMAKRQCNVESWFTDDDSYLTLLCDICEEKISTYLCVSVDALACIGGSDKIPGPIVLAILLNVAEYYKYREDTTGVQSKALVPRSLPLLGLYRDFSK